MAVSWTCPSCGQRRRSNYCSECGEERLRPRDLTLADTAARFARTISSLDGKLARSARAILTAPGTLTDSYVRGERRRFLGPLQLFLVANALFFAVQSMTSMNVLASTLDSHQHVQDWQAFARSLVAHRFGSDQRDIATFAQRFDQAAVFNAKALIILMVLAFAPVAALLFRISERSAGAHVVFALHIYTFVLVVLCIALGLAEMDLLLNGGGLASPNVDTWLTVANLAACAVYIYFAVGPAYRANGPFRFVAASILTATVAVLFVGYRFAIFVITFYTV